MNRFMRRFVETAGVLLCVAVVSVCIFAIPAFAAGEIPAQTLTTKTNDRQVTVAWRQVPDATQYGVWRSLGTSGDGATCIAILSATEGSTYVDQTAAPGTTYYYAVRSVGGTQGFGAQSSDGLSWKGPVKLNVTWDGVYSPHMGERFSADHRSGCRTCHEFISQGKPNAALLNTAIAESNNAAATTKCISCHMESKAPAQQAVGALFAAKGSGHDVATKDDPNAALSCVSCHNPHADSTQNTYLKPKTVTLGKTTKDVGEGNNAWCLSCHDDSQTWYTQTSGKAYPDTAKPERETQNVSGYFDYPTLGTFPGEGAYKASGHDKIMASGNLETGDCRYCHASHKSDAPYDGLLASTRGEYRAMKTLSDGSNSVDPTERLSGAYAGLCLSCHGDSRNELDPRVEGSDEATTTNIKALVVPEASEVTTSNAGHRIQSANAAVPQNSNMPCYYCHNAHGSKSGNVALISDERGSNIKEADLGRTFCFSCHATDEGTIWDFSARKWVHPAEDAKVLGLSRTGIDKTILDPKGVANKLRLPALVDGAHSANSTTPCATCHGDVHDPQVKASQDTETRPVVTGMYSRSAEGTNHVLDSAYFGAEPTVASIGVEFSTSEDLTGDAVKYAMVEDLSTVTARLDGGSYFSVELADLEPGTTYYYRAIRENADGTLATGDIRSFTTSWF